MPRTSAKRGRPRAPEMQHYIFEIREGEPRYLTSVNTDKYADAPYREYVSIDIDAPCIFPEKLAGRVARIRIAGEREHMTPAAFQRDSNWRPLCVGALHLPPTGGEFYMSVPLENLSFLLTAILHERLRYLCLWGPVLSRGKSHQRTFPEIHRSQRVLKGTAPDAGKGGRWPCPRPFG